MARYADTFELQREYRLKRLAITKRLKQFNKFDRLSERQVFEELVFCLFTPGSKALNGDRAVKKLKKNKLLYNGSKEKIAQEIRGIVRFHNNKAGYLIEARDLFSRGAKFAIKKNLIAKGALETRQWLVGNVKGIGYKEAGHFMRNIGLGRDLVILDTHILKNLKRFNVIRDIPVSMGKKLYFHIEERMRRFAKDIDIPLDALDLLFWSHQTGFIYK
ncbi:MAG: N-glycosylase/DNA lyase [Candidatus Orphnella occulta]|nr:N-glycosylase/DNA lyase [Candidatus Orphnella occulta]